MGIIYLDNAASTAVVPEVAEAMREFLTDCYGNPSSLHSQGRKAREAIENARDVVARRIHARAEEIVFTSGGTESNNLTLRGFAASHPKKIILTTATEHPSILNTANALREDGVPMRILPVTHEGFVVLEKIEYGRGGLLSAIHGNNEIGTINDITRIGKFCRDNGMVFHTDACQSFMKEEIDVRRAGVGLMTLNAHKLHGPKGVGALYVREGVKSGALLSGGEQENGLRAGTENVPGIVGFAAAIKMWKQRDNLRMKRLRDEMIKALLEIPDSRLNGSRSKRLCNNVNISFRGVEGEQLCKHLDARGIMASTGSACTSTSIEPSHMLRAIGLPDELAVGSIRLTLSRYTTKEEVDGAVRAVEEIVGDLRRVG